MATQQKLKTFGEIIKTTPLVLVDFYAEWCGPCKMMKPILEEVKAAIGEKAKIIKVDEEKNIKAASTYQVTGVPTLVLFRGGKIVWRNSGVVSSGQLKKIIESNV